MNEDAAALIDQLRSTLGKMETSLGRIADAIAWTDADGKVQWCNAAFDRLVDRPHLYILGADLPDLLPLRNRGRAVSRQAHPISAALSSGSQTDGLYERARHGGKSYLEISAACLRLPPSGLSAVVTIHDVTQRILSEEAIHLKEEQMAFAQKTEALGRLAGGITHEISNTLTGIVGLANLIKRDLGNRHPSRTDVEQVLSLSQKAGDLVRRLLAFARRGQSRRVSLDLNTLIEENRNISSALFGESIEFRFAADTAAPLVAADRSQLEQVLMNLYLNARDAMKSAGILTVETKAVSLDKPLVRAHGTLPPGSYAVFSVSDTGGGIEPEAQAHLFEPFFTTKEPGKGTGLGLSVAYGIIKDHGGLIDFESEAGRGSTFRVYLPAAAAGAVSVPDAPAARSMRGTETLLIIEDEPILREALARLLTSNGYTVLLAKDGYDAVEKFREKKGLIDLVLLDVVMPVIMGTEVQETIRRLNPKAKVMFMSGHANAKSMRVISQSEAPFIAKPFTPDELAAKIRDVLDS